MNIDPILVLTAAITTAVILASAASHKWRGRARFATQLEAYELLPRLLLKPAALLLPLVEIGVAFALLVPVARSAAALAAAALLALYAGAIGVNLLRGRAGIDCGCSGPDNVQPLRPVLLARNSVLVLLALGASVSPLAREMGLFDGFVVLAASAVLLLIYAAAEGLLANGPRLFKLIGR